MCNVGSFFLPPYNSRVIFLIGAALEIFFLSLPPSLLLVIRSFFMSFVFFVIIISILFFFALWYSVW